MHRHIYCLFWGLLISLQSLTAQLTYRPAQVVPPSPEATAAFKFTEVPVSFYTGMANTSIPLFEIKAGNKSLPIILNYHGRGVRVEEIASRVGIGWSLSYGGMISRQTRGKTDDGLWGYLTMNFYNDVFTNNTTAGQVANAYTNNQVDLEPDVFMFDAAGLSGKFQFDQRDKAVLQQSYSDTKIVPVWNNTTIHGWVVTDKEGNKYYFGVSKDNLRRAVDSEWVHNYSYVTAPADLGVSEDRPVNTWHLMEIETATNDLIQFTYQTESSEYWKRQYDQNADNARGAISFYGEVHSGQNQVKEISFPNGKVKFIRAASQREDLQGSYALEKIELYDKSDQLVKGYSFQYQYPTSNQVSVPSHLGLLDPRAAKRLFLYSVQETGRSGALVPPYTFTYSNTALPNRHSTAQDAWGFFNGADNGDFLTFFQSGRNAVREVDIDASEAGLLKKITYPTGGSVSFTYEHNVAMPPAYMEQLLFTDPNPTQLVTMHGGFLKHPSYFDGVRTYSNPVVIGTAKKGPVLFKFERFGCLNPDTDEPRNCNFTVRLEGTDIQGNARNFLLFPPATVDYRELNILPGNYTLKVLAPPGFDPASSSNAFFADLRWKELQTFQPEPGTRAIFAGGKRIKRIDYREANGLVKVKEFGYSDPVTGNTTGKLFGLPNYYFVQKIGNIGTVDKYGSIPGSPLSNLQGNSVGYSFVTEYYGDSLSNMGKIEYRFTTSEDGGKFYEFPYTMPIDNEWLRGKLLTTQAFEATPGGYVPKKLTVNKYAYAGEPDVEGVFYAPFTPSGQNAVYTRTRTKFYLPLMMFHKDTIVPYNYFVYYQTGGAMDLYQTTETDYNGTGAIAKQTDYFYNYDNHYLSVGNEMTDSKGDVLVSKQYFLPDMPSRTAAEQAMLDANQISSPIRKETIVKRANTELSKVTSYTKYRNWGNNILKPELVQSATNANPLETDAQFYSYDASGNPVEIEEKNGVRTVYVWGYDGQNPVAKVVGSTAATVQGFVNLAMLTNARQYTDLEIRTELNKIRTGLSNTNAQVSTYTYKPLVGMSSETDARGRTTFYEYDDLARLTVVRNHENSIVKKINYEYTNNNTAPLQYSSEEQIGVFTKNDCGGTGVGSAVEYSIPQGAYTSLINLEDANQKARNALAAEGQAHANAVGSCVWSNVARDTTLRRSCSVGVGSQSTYTVEAGRYTSTISQVHADQQAQTDLLNNAQNYANSQGNCTVTVRASITLGEAVPEFRQRCFYQYQDVTVNFYSDAALTVPFDVTNLGITIKKRSTPYLNGQPQAVTETTTGYTVSGTSFTIPALLTFQGCAANCPAGQNCLPTLNDPHTDHVYSLTQTTFTIIIP